ncbi:MAG: hypothetical protein RBR22_08110 [Desulfuromonas sp.]|nr:hypothetical protein [Desulfuromonas sp.]
MISLPSIVLIDDKKDDLESLQDSFIQAGYPCFPIHYKKDDPENISGVDHVNLSMIKPRIIITDLNLQELQIDAKTLVGPIAEVLKRLPIDGPYLLYFWSRNKEHVEKVINLIFERHKEIPLPLYYEILDKAKFKTNPEDLNKEIKKIFTGNPIFNALFSWENRVSSAAQATTDSLFKLAKSLDPENISDFQLKTKKKLEIMLAIIGNEAIGVKNAQEEPGLAVELGLEPVLRDHIQSNYERIDNNSIWHQAANSIGTRLDSKFHSDVIAHLNSFYHVEELNNTSPKNKRGSWITFNSAYLENSINKPKIEKNLGRSIKALLNEEFLNCRIGTSESRSEARRDTKLGFIELSAECDQAQRKTKLNRYLLSAMIPIEHEQFTFHGTEGRDTAHAGIYRLPKIIVDGKEYIIKVSFMYQVGAIPDFNKWLGTPMFRLKDQILSDISFRASQHLTRPGITRFD